MDFFPGAFAVRGHRVTVIIVWEERPSERLTEDSRPMRLISRKASSVSFLTNDDCNKASGRNNLREWGLDLGPGSGKI